MSSPEKHVTEPSNDWSVFIPSLIAVVLTGIALIGFTEPATRMIESARLMVTTNFGWLYLLFGFGSLLFCFWLAFGRFGQVRFGPEDEPPEYSNSHWIAMMFTAGIGAGLIAWGFAEPVFYIQSPPFGIAAHSSQAFEFAHMYPLFHWGIIPWGVYAIPAVPVAYMLYIRNDDTLRISHAIEGSVPGSEKPLVRTIVDVAMVLGIMGGTATSLGLGVPLVSAFLAELTGVEDNVYTKMVVLVFYTLLFGASAYRGLKKGIKVLADINMVLALLAIVFILLAGPTLFILSISVNSVGLFIDNFVRMSFWMDPIEKSGFVEDWTVFYWAWWIAFAAFIGLFFGRISRGRTVKQLVLGVIGWGTLGTTAFLMISGGYILYLEHSGAFPASANLTEFGMSMMVAQALTQLPGGSIVLFVFFILAIIFYATTLDSAAYVLASICSKDLANDQEPPRVSRLVWAGLLAFLTAGLIKSGGLDAVKAMTVLFSVPLIPILILMCIAQVKWFKRDFPDGR